MSTLWIVIAGFLMLLFGGIIGFVMCAIRRNASSYAGRMVIIREEDRLVYSLELDEDPAMLEHKPEVVFRVVTSDESSSRK